MPYRKVMKGGEGGERMRDKDRDHTESWATMNAADKSLKPGKWEAEER